ncbi:LysR family transcriptional regulator [Opitutaceae bacterium TAV5]|nr:LysR family transcriptional regulator [Opitutaceae bacterium TAV5]
MPREYQFPFELRHLVYFREVARLLHFRKAAESLAVAQPALSRQIAQLEQALDAPLFLRSRRRVELTAAGKALAERIEPLLRSLSLVPGELQALAEGETGHLRLGFTGLAMATVLPGILREFHKKHPRIRLELNESPTATQLAALKAGEIACGFFHPDATATPGVRTRLLLRERNGVVLPAEHPLRAREELRLRDLGDTPFVLFPRTHNAGFYDRILAAFSRADTTPRVVEEVWPRSNAIGLVRAGMGATFMCPSEARQLPPEVVFRPLAGPAPESRLVIGWRAAAESEPALAAFLDAANIGHPGEREKPPPPAAPGHSSR